MTLEEIFTLENLNNAFYQSSKISHWKDNTQRYKSILLIKNIELMEEILNHEYKVSPTTNFTIRERGKVRLIESPSQRDRIVQKVLCNKVLIPYLTKPLIYDNYASLKNRGTSFARKRIDVMLNRFIRQYGSDGYVLQIDIKKYFESIDHETLKAMVHERVNEPKEVMDLIDYVIDTSSHTHKGLNLGSEAPQILAIFYLSNLDNYIKSVLRVKYYGRYMDDMILFSNSKEELQATLESIKEKLAEIKLEISEKKTHISKLSQGFTYMQIKYLIVGNKIIKRPTRAKITRERRRLKKYKRLYEQGLMNELEIHNCYKSWRNNIIKECKYCTRSIRNMDALYNELFQSQEEYKRPTRNSLIRNSYKENRNETHSTHKQ